MKIVGGTILIIVLVFVIPLLIDHWVHLWLGY